MNRGVITSTRAPGFDPSVSRRKRWIPRRFEKLVWPLLRGRMSQLDAARIPGPDNTDVPLVVDRTTAVCIGTAGGRVVGELLRVRDEGTDRISVTREDGTTTLEGRSS